MNATLALRSAQSDSGNVTGTPVWLGCEPEQIFCVLHAPAASNRTRLAALILPPFGWDNDSSYRVRRDWATALAEAGIAVARIDFPGTENSVGPALAPNRVQSWVDAATFAARWLRERTGCERLVGVGIGLGGLIAHQATAAGAAIDDLILWAVRASGRSYVRELRAFAAVMADQAGDAGETREGVVGIGGHVISDETLAALSAIKLGDNPLPDASRRRVLLLGRDAHGVDRALQAHYEESGVSVSVIETADYHCLVGRPELQLVPVTTIARARDWILDPSARDLGRIEYPSQEPVPPDELSVGFSHEGVEIRESIEEIETTAGRVVGVISEPALHERVPYCMVIVNAGALRHTGPSRMFVTIARSAAAAGIPVARFDLPGLGDSDGTAAKTFERGPDDDRSTLSVLSQIYEHLEARGLATQFVPAGLCSGGYFALLMTAHDRRSIGALALNPPTLRWGEVERRAILRGLMAEAGTEATAKPNRDHWPRRLQVTVDQVERLRYIVETRVRSRMARIDLVWRSVHRAEVGTAVEVVDRVGASGARTFIQLAEHEPLAHMFAQPKVAARLKRWPNITVEGLPTHDHDLRPLSVQDVVFQRVGLALEELRVRAIDAAGVQPGSSALHQSDAEVAGGKTDSRH